MTQKLKIIIAEDYKEFHKISFEQIALSHITGYYNEDGTITVTKNFWQRNIGITTQKELFDFVNEKVKSFEEPKEIDVSTPKIGEQVRSYLFLVNDISENEKIISFETLTGLIKSITCTEEKTTIEFYLDEENTLWNFFKRNSPFSVSWMARNGKIIDKQTFKYYFNKKQSKQFIKNFSYDHSSEHFAIGVKIIYND